MSEFKEKVVVVTGGSRGIGKACALYFAQNGADVVFTYNKNKEKAEKLKEKVESFSRKCLIFQLDVGDYERCREFSEKVIDNFKRVDILINNAGITKDKALMMMSKDDWNDVINTNLSGIFNVTKSFVITFMKQKQGNIINITSLSGIIGLPRQANYSASKGGMIAFTRSLSREVAQFNIRVNAVAPGFINTDMVSELKEDHVKEIMPEIPLGRFGEADEVAKVAGFLASDRSNYITGQIIRIDGGLRM